MISAGVAFICQKAFIQKESQPLPNNLLVKNQKNYTVFLFSLVGTLNVLNAD